MSPSDRPPLLTLKCYAFAQNLFIVDKFHGKYKLIVIHNIFSDWTTWLATIRKQNTRCGSLARVAKLKKYYVCSKKLI
jgi:hypothetical protein